MSTSLVEQSDKLADQLINALNKSE
jgi:hypothetical protein